MDLKCEYCGEMYTVYDKRRRKYCPECQRSGKRHAAQFKRRRRNEPILHCYTSHYSKRHALYKKGKITKGVLDEWCIQATIKQHEISNGDISFEDFKTWCEQTYKSLID